MLIWFALACRPPPPLPPPPAAQPVVIDYRPLYGGHSSMSVVDYRIAEADLLQRVRFEASALSSMRDDASVEPWARMMLMRVLAQQGALIMGPPVGNDLEPTLVIRDVHFGIGYDTLDATVQLHEDGDRYVVGIRAHAHQASLCSPDLQVSIPYLALHGTAQRADGVVVAIWHEVSLPEVSPERGVGTFQMLPDQLCAAIPQLLEQEPDLQPNASEFEQAAQKVLLLALQPFAPDGTSED